MKFWKTGKIVKAVSESDYQKLQRSRGRSTDQPGPGRSIPVIVSDSDSDGPLVPLVWKKRKIFHVPTPPGSDSDSSQCPPNGAHTSIETMFKEVASMIQDVKKQLDNSMHIEHGENALLKEIFTYLICKQISVESARPVVPLCCNSVVCCYDCISQWICSSPVCPRCRSPIMIDDCLPQLTLKPIFNIIGDAAKE